MMHKAWSSIEEVPYCFSRSYVKLQSHTALKMVDFDPNWAFPDWISSFNSPMAMKWHTKLGVALKRCPIVFQGHTSNCKLKKSSNLTQIGRFRTVTPVWIHWWIWNDTQSLMLYRRRALLFFGVIHQISRSHGEKSTIWIQFEKDYHAGRSYQIPQICLVMQVNTNKRHKMRYREHGSKQIIVGKVLR